MRVRYHITVPVRLSGEMSAPSMLDAHSQLIKLAEQVVGVINNDAAQNAAPGIDTVGSGALHLGKGKPEIFIWEEDE